MRAHQLVGILLWRGGMLLAAGSALVLALRFVLRFVEVPLQIEIGLSLTLAGVVLVTGSMIAERIRDRRQEGDEP